MATISLGVIVKNDERLLDSFLSLHEPFVDEIIVVDTGSRDKTKEIAKKHGKVKLFEISWEDDFSKARNACKDHASKEWVLMLDPDEQLKKEDLEKIKQYMDSNKADAIALQLPQQNQSPISVPQNSLVKAFKNNKQFMYQYRVYEIIEPSILEHKKNIMIVPVSLQFHGEKSRQQEEARQEYYKKLLELEIRELPQDPKPWFELGMAYYTHKEFEKALSYFEKAVSLKSAVKIWDFLGHTYYQIKEDEKAFDAYRHAILLSPNPAFAFRNLGIFFLKENKEALALRAFGESLKHDPIDIATLNNAAFLFLRHNEQEKAEQLFEQIKEICKEKGVDLPLKTLTNWGMSYLQRKEYGKAEEMFKKALVHEDVVAYGNLAELYLKTGKKDKAREIIKKAEAKKLQSKQLTKLKEELS